MASIQEVFSCVQLGVRQVSALWKEMQDYLQVRRSGLRSIAGFPSILLAGLNPGHCQCPRVC